MNDDEARLGCDENPWTLTAGGNQVHFLRPDLDALVMDDICHHLSNICRFTGAVSRFYSVAQHSCLVAAITERLLKNDGVDSETSEYWDQLLAALLHDAGEAYCSDISSPLKHVMGGKYNWIETGLTRKIYEKHDIDWAYHNRLVKRADYHACLIERKALLPESDLWPVDIPLMFGDPKLMYPPQAAKAMAGVFTSMMLRRDALREEEGYVPPTEPEPEYA
jgi:hypothetical protein